MTGEVLHAFGLSPAAHATAFGTGLINHTWKIEDQGAVFILQRLNTTIFKNPGAIAGNVAAIGAYLQQHSPGYLLPVPIKTIKGEDYYISPANDYYRLVPFVNGSHTADALQQPRQAFEAAAQFGKFTRLLEHFESSRLQITLPDFHNLSLRHEQFRQSLQNGNPERIAQSKAWIEKAGDYTSIVETFEKIRHDTTFRQRVTHHDTKISNVLFDDSDKGICVIDLDTVMPGYFISDAGDMIRTYVCPVSEEENDLSKISIREDYFEALTKGYLGELGTVLTEEEKKHFVYSGKFMIYMQALRFLTDHLNNDTYYGARYQDHNLARAANQFTLLQQLVEKETILQNIVSNT